MSDIKLNKEHNTNMARIQPVLDEAETALVDQMSEITRTKRTDVIKNALAVYHWFLRQAITGARVVARKPTGEEVTLETPELSRVEGAAQLLSAKELGLLAKKLAATKDAKEAAQLKERIARGFYGI
jgi:hypothetical protein